MMKEMQEMLDDYVVLNITYMKWYIWQTNILDFFMPFVWQTLNPIMQTYILDLLMPFACKGGRTDSDYHMHFLMGRNKSSSLATVGYASIGSWYGLEGRTEAMWSIKDLKNMVHENMCCQYGWREDGITSLNTQLILPSGWS